MAKERLNGWLRLISVTVMLVFIIVGGVKAWAVLAERQDVQAASAIMLKEEGCFPARENSGQIGRIEERLHSIDTRQAEFSIEQKDMRKEGKEQFHTILKELRK